MKTTTVEQRVCERHGGFESRQLLGTIWTTCARCEQERGEREQETRAQAARTERRDARFRDSGLIGRFAGATLDNFHVTLPAQAKGLQVCRACVDAFEPDRWAPLWLLGGPGAGKTHLASGMVHAIIDRDFSAHITTSREMIARLRSTWRKDACESEEDLVNYFGRVAFLAIDEIGMGYGTDSELTQLLDIVDLRYRLQRNVVISSNLDAHGLRGLIGGRLYDRLRENATVVACAWPSYRGARASTAPSESAP